MDFRKSVIYQVYPKSFADSNGDGIGDIQGIIDHLDYIQSLGVDYIWSTPFFASPMNDNGYDIQDYKKINPLFGTMEDVEELIRQGKKRKLGIMLDMVFNHTSTYHEWFQKALAGDEKYMAYYYFLDGEENEPPTNWQSKFGGSAWEYVPSLKKWYLHLFDVTQADLNWENPQVREELKEIINFWVEKGVAGFRFDVINLISKPDVWENDTEGDGRSFYTDGPRVHAYLKELVRDTGIDALITVGEMSSTTLDNCIHYSNPQEKELSMCFNFHHLKIDYKNGDKWELKNPDYKELRDIFQTWQLGMQEQNGWNAVFWCNHDQPRILSRLGDEGKYWKESGKMLATCIHLMRGTPYIYQGEELGMTNPGYHQIDEYRDVESKNYYEILLAKGKSREEALEILGQRSRDNGRTPMQWNAGENAGFSSARPWIQIPDNYKKINAEKELAEEDSILNYYKKLVQIRKELEVVQKGKISFLCEKEPAVFAYDRQLEGERLLVVNNLTGERVKLRNPVDIAGYKQLLGNYAQQDQTAEIHVLRPYESLVLFRGN